MPQEGKDTGRGVRDKSSADDGMGEIEKQENGCQAGVFIPIPVKNTSVNSR